MAIKSYRLAYVICPALTGFIGIVTLRRVWNNKRDFNIKCL